METLDFRVTAEWDYADEKLAYIVPPADDRFQIEVLGGGEPAPQDVLRGGRNHRGERRHHGGGQK